ncbi:hypothetical protein TARUN_1763 [Trichoderma arundinaceum]|uniref:DUF2293 domain-containing protein n=1 Tax=Trichoderma arundinaceum TaxID=490622 RepID=A0A395NWG2_TRIAR|nr:hypothetical protein TARUN_1763 [Trichoderma arundinaceum]
MGRARRGLVPAAASGPKERHKRSQRSQYHNPYSPPHESFVAKPPLPKSKHHSYFELVENKEKKKKLEYQITTRKTPPPGFEFVPIGNPQLTAACKELSREKDVMIFIVSNAKGLDENILANQVHRIGHHIRQVIVEEAKTSVGDMPHHAGPATNAGPEPIPDSQRAYHAQVDAAIRDLFPRIPNTDRQMIIEHSFTRGSTNRSEHPVGFSEDIPLSRRVQLAVLAHIRHTHTRYDALLRETTWQNARKIVESLCLDILVKWRGDEETGRDQLDEILREVVVISDSEEDDDDDDQDDEESTDYTSNEGADNARLTPMPVYRSAPPLRRVDQTDRSPPKSPIREAILVPSSPPNVRVGLEDTDRGRREDRRAQRGFRRYRAWEEAIRRNRGGTPLVERPSLDMTTNHTSYQLPQPNGLSYDAHGRPFGTSGPMAHPNGASGASPNLNGHRVQRPVYEVPSSLNSSPYRGQIIEVQSSHEQVMSVVPFPTSTSSRELASSASSHFQDMLVHSIEPVSPVAQPSFIRTLPPRSHGAVSSYAPLATPLPSFQQPPRLVSHPGERIHTWDRPPATHVTPGYDRLQEAMEVDVVSSRESVQSHDFRGHTYPHSTGYEAQPTSSFSHLVSGNPGPNSSRLPETRRIVLNATRPGERSNPILMEDRGGYYERINPRPEGGARIQLRPSARPVQPQTEVEVQGVVRPHTIFSWEEDLRNRRQRRGVAEIEISPIYDSRPHAPYIHPYPPHGYLGAPRLEPLTKEEDYRAQARQVPSGEHAAPPPEGYWVIHQHSDRQVSRPHHEPVYHALNARPSGADERYDNRREHRPLTQPAPNVIVID